MFVERSPYISRFGGGGIPGSPVVRKLYRKCGRDSSVASSFVGGVVRIISDRKGKAVSGSHSEMPLVASFLRFLLLHPTHTFGLEKLCRE